MFDVLIIGGGVTGCLIARELTQYDLKICLIEKNSDVAMGASGANSGIVHAGYDPTPGTMKAKLNIEGSDMFEKLMQELDVPFERKGSLVTAFDHEDEQKLFRLLENGKKNHVPSLRLLCREEILNMEPLISDDVKSALYAPTSGVTCPYSLTIAAAENAVSNGAFIYLNQKVQSIVKEDGFFTTTTQASSFNSKFIINAAGVYADEISELAGAEHYTITPCKGEYLLFDKTAAKPNMVLFQTPSELGKGVLVTGTVHGNLLVGPSALDQEKKNDTSISAKGLEHITALGIRTFPNINLKKTITQFSGIRAVSNNHDFIIEPSKTQKGFIQVAGISSPGLTAAPAIAKYVAELLEKEGLSLIKKLSFNPYRKRIQAFASLSDAERNTLIQYNTAYGRIICRCEQISEAEIIESIRRPVGATTLDGVKRRVRAGMGRCQGGFCSPAVLKILAEELNKPIAEITKCGEGSNILVGKTK